MLGPNGSGKSTLVKSVYGLARIFGGSIRLNEIELAGLPAEQISGYGLAYVPQRENIFTSLTVGENLQLAGRKLDRALSQQGLAETFEIFPILKERAPQYAGQLSGGE